MEKTTIKKSELLKFIKEDGYSRKQIAEKYGVPVSRVHQAVNYFGLKGVKLNTAPVTFEDDTVINEGTTI